MGTHKKLHFLAQDMASKFLWKALMLGAVIGALLLIEIYLIDDDTGMDIDIPETEQPAEIDNTIGGGTDQETSAISAYLCATDDCEGLMIDFLSGAERSIHCAIYDLELEGIIDALNSKSADDGMDVKVVADDGYEPEGLTAEYILDTSSQYSHNKFCIVDGIRVWTGSMNPTERGVRGNDNNVVVIESTVLAGNYEDEFEELWGGEFGKGGEPVENPIVDVGGVVVENYFCPEDDCSGQLIDEIRDAETSVHFMTFSFTHEDIANALLELDTDVLIRGVFENSQAGSQYSQFDRLSGFGLDVVKDGNGYTMHHKVFIIDNATVVTGSFNPTKSGDEKNDENFVIIHDAGIASLFLSEFDRVYAEAIAASVDS